jgi:hypothetical protein
VSKEVKLDWSSAEVHDGKLTIALDGKPQKDWKRAFERTTRLLSRGKWEEVTLKKGRVSLRPIAPGEEDRVRHFLESALLQANSAVGAADEGDAERGEDAEGGKEEAREHTEDQEMTDRLRSFAEGASRPRA